MTCGAEEGNNFEQNLKKKKKKTTPKSDCR